MTKTVPYKPTFSMGCRARHATQRANIGGEGLFDEPDEETELDEDENFEEEEDWQRACDSSASKQARAITQLSKDK